MSGLGIGEILVIAVIALVLLGPEKFPEFAKVVTRTVKDLRGYMNEVKRDITEELRPVNEEVRKLSRYDPEDYIDALTREGEEGESPEDDTEDAPYHEDEDVGDTPFTDDETAPDSSPPTGDEELSPDESTRTPKDVLPSDGYDKYDD